MAASEIMMLVESDAQRAACEEAEATRDALAAKMMVLRDHLKAYNERVERRDATAESLKERSEELALHAHDSEQTVELMREGISACDKRLDLTKQLLRESARKLEALRTRGGVAEEMHRAKTIALGVAGERLLERAQQLRAVTLHCMEQRLRVGLDTWLPMQKRGLALAKWRDAATSRRARLERLHGASRIWGVGALQHAVDVWLQRGGRLPPALREPSAELPEIQ